MSSFLSSSIKQYRYYESLGFSAIQQCPEDKLFWTYNDHSNSIAVIVNHISGNMLSRWTNFMTSDGEKTWRNRENEFENILQNKAEIISTWEKGWNCLFTSLNSLTANQMEDIIYIRNQGHTVTEAIQRQLAHYSYHIGQIVYICKLSAGEEWKSLSIPKGKSSVYNESLFIKGKTKRHFTDTIRDDLKNLQ